LKAKIRLRLAVLVGLVEIGAQHALDDVLEPAQDAIVVEA
jgi:hypothetical protein